MTATYFSKVVERLLTATGLDTETKLGDRLGFTQTAWAKRKMRDSIPTDQIKVLIESEGLSEKFVYFGLGPMHAPVDDAKWQQGYEQRAVALTRDVGSLIAKGHTPEVLTALTQPSGLTLGLLAALRDHRNLHGTDLNWLITSRSTAPVAAVPAPAPEAPALPADEQRLLALYRLAEPAVRKAVVGALAVGEAPAIDTLAETKFSTQPTPEVLRHGDRSVTIHGAIGQRIEGPVVVKGSQTFHVGGTSVELPRRGRRPKGG